jgi:hypothetical protein
MLAVMWSIMIFRLCVAQICQRYVFFDRVLTNIAVQIRKIAPEFYEHLTVHTSWLRIFYDFIFDPEMSLRSRIKRKMAPPSEYHFYGVGVYATSHIYNFCQTVLF